MKYIIIESIIICIFLTVIIVLSKKKNPLSGIHNLPIKIQEKVQTRDKILTTRQRVIKKIPALFIVFILFCIFIYFNGAKSFMDGFLYSFVLWFIVKIYVVVVLDCLWYAHSPKYWIKGTEELKEEYQNYKFYLSSIPRSLLAGLIVAVLIGLVIEVI